MWSCEVAGQDGPILILSGGSWKCTSEECRRIFAFNERKNVNLTGNVIQNINLKFANTIIFQINKIIVNTISKNLTFIIHLKATFGTVNQ